MRKRTANSSCVRPSARRITLTRGTRFSCFSRLGVRGGLSGSLNAAALISSSVIARRAAQSVGSGGEALVVPSGRTSTRVPSGRRLATIVRSLLIVVGLSGRDDADAGVALGVSDSHEQSFDPSGGKKAILAIVLSEVLLQEYQWVVKYTACGAEAYLMLAEVGLRLDVVPFEFVILHEGNGYQ